MKTIKWSLLFIVVVFLGACTPTADAPIPASPTPAPATSTATVAPTASATPDILLPTPGRILISEFIPGVPGDNNFEFIELYNAGTEAVDLKGWSLWYKMLDDKEAQRVYVWTARADVPGYGHYLLARAGEDIGAAPDAVYEVPLFERKGGLVLLNADKDVVDTLGWGDAPAEFVADRPAVAPADGASLERAPGGDAGNAMDTDDSSDDFFVQSMPNPQNRGTAPVPLPEKRLIITAQAPESVMPGTEFSLDVRVENQTGEAVNLATVVLPVPLGFAVLETPPDAIVDEALIEIPVAHLDVGASETWGLVLRSPWNYNDVFMGGIYVHTPDWPLRAYAPLVPIAIEGGAIPIAKARTLEGSIVTIEGVATMYTGGFYAGSTGTKFYLQDETGGVQVYCPGAQGVVKVRVGDQVRVTGMIEIYRGAVEVIPGVYPDHVEVLGDVEAPAPVSATAREATVVESLLGQLIEVEGTVTRFEEFSYSYEVDLMDAEGHTVLVYIDKDTNINPEFLEVGKQYRIAGISEMYDTTWQLKPRTRVDFVQVFPPELMLELRAQNSVEAGDLLTYTLTAFNHMPDPVTNLKITAEVPDDVALVAVLDGGNAGLLGGISWNVPELAGQGDSIAVRYVVQVGDVARVTAPPAVATADQWEQATSQVWMTFIGSGVPIWAIQGEGASSPFVRSMATTEGVVTGVFPEQSGFWIQSVTPDQNPATSEGLFVLVASDVPSMPVMLGDQVLVTGKIREVSGQTLIYLEMLENLEIVGRDHALPDAVELDPPQDEATSRAQYEALEGMLVAITEPALVVAPTSKYGETALVRPSWGISRVMRGDELGMLMFVDDGSDATHLDRSTMWYAVKTGDRVQNVLGPLAFTYENYKIQPIITPTLVTAETALPVLPPADENAFSIATFNVENFFDIVDPHPSDPPKPRPDEYRLRVTKVANTVLAMGMPVIVGLQEIENVGVLEDIAAHEKLAEYDYIPALIEGFDSRGIDVGYLVRGDIATLHSVSQHVAPEGLTSRPPLLITVTLHLASGHQTMYVFNNHFTSMAGGEAPTEPRRTAQAEWNVTLVQELVARDPDALVVVLGDLNSFYTSRPIAALREGGLRHVYELTEPDIPYTYIYQGESETLDHILMSPSLYAHLEQVHALHVNADYPPAAPGDPSPEHTSDHDPLVAVFSFD